MKENYRNKLNNKIICTINYFAKSLNIYNIAQIIEINRNRMFEKLF